MFRWVLVECKSNSNNPFNGPAYYPQIEKNIFESSEGPVNTIHQKLLHKLKIIFEFLLLSRTLLLNKNFI